MTTLQYKNPPVHYTITIFLLQDFSLHCILVITLMWNSLCSFASRSDLKASQVPRLKTNGAPLRSIGMVSRSRVSFGGGQRSQVVNLLAHSSFDVQLGCLCWQRTIWTLTVHWLVDYWINIYLPCKNCVFWIEHTHNAYICNTVLCIEIAHPWHLRQLANITWVHYCCSEH